MKKSEQQRSRRQFIKQSSSGVVAGALLGAGLETQTVGATQGSSQTQTTAALPGSRRNVNLRFEEQPQIVWGVQYLEKTLRDKGYNTDLFRLTFKQEQVNVPGKFGEQGFRLIKQGRDVTISAPAPVGALYGLVEVAERVLHGDTQVLKASKLDLTDAPAMKYRGYCLGLQRPKAFYPDHKQYDWPITPQHFPWLYDRAFLIRLLDRLARHRANALYLWNGHPFASLLKLKEYPEAPEVSDAQLLQNMEQYRWLTTEAEKRGVWVVQMFYNIHMSDPLAKKRGWDIMAGVATPELIAYTKSCLREFIRTYPSVGIMAAMAEVLKEEHKAKWLETILQGVLEGLGPNPTTYPPVVIRAHEFNVEKYLPAGQKLYPNIVTESKHNNESYISTRPDSNNTAMARVSGQHLINVHLCANLEPFAWGSPRFIRRTVRNMLKYEASGIHVYPLRYWDFPNSAHTKPLGDQLQEHFLWWSAWGRYGWNPERDEADEDGYWERELAVEYRLNREQAAALLYAMQETGPVLPQIAGQFIITSGNGQAINLGQKVVQLAFSRQEFQDGGGYSMGQMCGFPVLNERMWTQSPAQRMERAVERCRRATERLTAVPTSPMIAAMIHEIGVMSLIARFYATKARATALYFQSLYGVPGASEQDALPRLEESVRLYEQIVAKTSDYFRDASSLHEYRRLPVRVTEGYKHWTDMLPVYKQELELARREGLRGLLRESAKNAKPTQEWNVGIVNTDEI